MAFHRMSPGPDRTAIAPDEPPSADREGPLEGGGLDTGDAFDELPTGVEPWAGDEMPEGTASSHDLHAPAPEHGDPGQVSSLPPERRGPDAEEAQHRRSYELLFRDLEVGQREAAAQHASDSDLSALCLDPSPRVIAALLGNMKFGLSHARKVALHHKSAQGIEILTRKVQFLRDQQVQRRLLQNMQTPESVVERILRSKRLLDVYRSSIDRELPEQNRIRVRARLKPCFTTAEPEERAALVIKTEGRCLINLSGCTFDARTTQILCNQTINSTLFIQNLARFSATPPLLLAKLLRSPMVQRQPQLRALLLRHPNVSGEVKRRG